MRIHYKDISVLIPTMNRPNSLKKTIQSYLDGIDRPKQIVVVDQSQDIELRKEVEQLTEVIPTEVEFQYIYLEKPSLTMARNIAIQCAKYDIVICSDDDIEVNLNTLHDIYEIMSNKHIAMIAGLDEFDMKSKTPIGYLLGTKSHRKRNIGHVTRSVLGRFPEAFKETTDTEWAMGFFFVVKKSLVDLWNTRWDEKLASFAYGEDLDFSYTYHKHAKQEGLACVIDKRVIVKHYATKEYRIPSRRSTFMYICNRYYLLHKHEFGSKPAFYWCNFWKFAERCVKKEGVADMWNAMKYQIMHRQEIIEGIFNF